MKKAMSVFGSLMLLSPIIINHFNSLASANLALTQSDKSNLLSLTAKSQGNKNFGWGDIIRRIIGILPDKPPKRGYGICSITPYISLAEKEQLKIWTTQPLFVWFLDEGIISENIEVKHIRSNTIIWSYPLSNNDQKEQKIRYAGQTLVPGRYEYKFTYRNLNNDPDSVTLKFRIIDQEKHPQVALELSKLSEDNPNETSEKLALARVNYFIDRGMVSDAIQEIFSIDNPSEELQKEIDELLSSAEEKCEQQSQ